MLLNRTCPIRCGANESWQHFDSGRGVCFFRQTEVHFFLHFFFYFQELIPAEPQGVQNTLALRVLLRQTIRHSGYHGSALAAAILRAHETHITVRYQHPHHLLHTPSKPAGREKEGAKKGPKKYT